MTLRRQMLRVGGYLITFICQKSVCYKKIDRNVRFQVVYQSWFWLASSIYIAPAAGTSEQIHALLRLGTFFCTAFASPPSHRFSPLGIGWHLGRVSSLNHLQAVAPGSGRTSPFCCGSRVGPLSIESPSSHSVTIYISVRPAVLASLH